jgi:hypothetical protein
MEISLQFENCVWEYLSCDSAEDVRKKETPQFILRVVDFMTNREEWRGSASELLAEMGDETTAVNTVTKLLNQYHSSILAGKGIEYRYHRTGKSRVIRLCPSDGYDSCDSSISP